MRKLFLVCLVSLSLGALAETYNATGDAVTVKKVLPERGTKGARWNGQAAQGQVVNKDGVVYMAEVATANEPPHADFRVLQTNQLRLFFDIENTGSTDIWIGLGSIPEVGKGTKLAPGDYWGVAGYQGAVYVVGASTVVGNDVPGGR